MKEKEAKRSRQINVRTQFLKLLYSMKLQCIPSMGIDIMQISVI
jgi:hypothetical protein